MWITNSSYGSLPDITIFCYTLELSVGADPSCSSGYPYLYLLAFHRASGKESGLIVKENSFLRRNSKTCRINTSLVRSFNLSFTSFAVSVTCPYNKTSLSFPLLVPEYLPVLPILLLLSRHKGQGSCSRKFISLHLSASNP